MIKMPAESRRSGKKSKPKTQLQQTFCSITMLSDFLPEALDISGIMSDITSVFDMSEKIDVNMDATRRDQQIRLINFLKFKSCNGFPCFSYDRDMTIPAEKVNRSISIIVFISHTWMRPTEYYDGYDTQPHPDNSSGDKFRLCVEGIEKIMTNLAPGFKECHLWIDYCCLDQDNNPAEDLDRLDNIMEFCDIIFTPIHDPDIRQEAAPDMRKSLVEYEADGWHKGPTAYLSRSWCRLEMIFGAYVPVIESSETRWSKFMGTLRLNAQHNRRPHLLFGTNESRFDRQPIVLPRLQNSDFDKYHPSTGILSFPEDESTVSRLLEQLRPYLPPLEDEYDGDVNIEGKRHGKGRYRYVSGAIYDGSWSNGKKDGPGVYHYPNGDVCVATWSKNETVGEVEYYYMDGDVYKGQFESGQMHGLGTYK